MYALPSTHLHVADVLPAPEWFKHSVAKPQHCQVLYQLLACVDSLQGGGQQQQQQQQQQEQAALSGSLSTPCLWWQLN
jgi:hypothetical protein